MLSNIYFAPICVYALCLTSSGTNSTNLVNHVSSHWALEKAMATHSSILAWRIPGTGEPGELQSMGSLRVRHDWWRLHFHFSLSCIGEGNGNPLQCSRLENLRAGGAWGAAVSGVAQSRTQLKRLSSSSSSSHWVDCYWLQLCSSQNLCGYHGGDGKPVQYSFLGNLMDRGTWLATVQKSHRSQKCQIQSTRSQKCRTQMSDQTTTMKRSREFCWNCCL